MIGFHTLKIKLILPILFILIIIFFASSYIIIDREYNAARTTLINNAESFAGLSVGSLINNYLIFYESGFYQYIQIVDNLMSLNEDIISLQLVDINGKILFDSIEIEDGKYEGFLNGERYLPDNESIERAATSTISTIIYEDEKLIDIIQPYIEEFGRHDYSVRFTASLSSLDDMTNEMILTISILSGVFIIVSFFLIFVLFNIFITKPVGELIKGVRLMGKGEMGHTVDFNSDDELGELSSAFNSMSIALKESQDQLKDYSENLEKLVTKRTKELDEKNKFLKEINKDLTIARKNLNKLNKTLEQRVKDRTMEVDMLLKQKDEFVNQLGHDLKTPLMPLSTLIPLLIQKEKDPKKREWLEVLERNVDYMKGIVIKTLELAKLNSPKTKFTLEKINLRKEVERTIENKITLFENKKIKLNNNITNGYYVQADKLRLEELLTNILENSIKYNKDKGEITIDAEKQKDYVKVSIRDTGIGMTNGQIRHIFDEFYKADQSRHDFESSGLGMTISKRIVERHNGKIWVESPGIGKGTTVNFTLPLVNDIA
ncbi:MAG: HAMP domain-containing protein [Thermoplasmatales archaeon]|nr:MAG: HAMP domain-containing protein [Thermoplasmatales archaeon]